MKEYITIDRSIHLVMVAFAFGSITNVYSYFVNSGHDMVASIALAVALGTALATSAIMATKMNMRKETLSFTAVLSMVLVIGLVSGYIQMQGYIQHGVAELEASIMGFGVPLAGEFLLALAFAIYTGAARRTKIHEADSALELRVAESVADVMAMVDVSSSAKYVERKIATVIRYKADQMLSHYIPKDVKAVVPAAIPDAKPIAEVSDEQNPSVPIILDAGRDKANRQKRQNAHSRRQALLALLNEQYADLPTEKLNKSQIGEELGTSARTIGRDIEALVEEGKVVLNGTVEVIN